jgi:hypothetical protein
MNDIKPTRLSPHQALALRGLRLPKFAIKRLQQAAIYCEPAVSIEYQRIAKKYVIRGRECGGATAQVGAYCGFTSSSGAALSWLSRVSAIGRNGVNAIVVAPELVRIQVFRNEHTYALLITHHQLRSLGEHRRPTLQNDVLFHGVYGILAMELWGKDSQFKGSVLPAFRMRSGEALLVPEKFEEAARKVIAAANCLGCQHCHLAQPASVVVTTTTAATTTAEDPAGDSVRAT